jgi:hypothetical protein
MDEALGGDASRARRQHSGHGGDQLPVANSINRYPIDSPRLPELRKDDDGSLTMDIQKGASGLAKESDWLPEPDGPVYMVLHLW